MTTTSAVPLWVEVFDLHGRSILKKIMPSDNQIYQLDIRNLNSGMYFIQLGNPSSSTMQRFIIE
ncbi:MAG: T9SS type A sorting domain-containing protein [Cyclobacteriaceae bacterium]|nr:T9SS type A sorting domain-containing protein [Cyclobacteriaceae bacterium]